MSQPSPPPETDKVEVIEVGPTEPSPVEASACYNPSVSDDEDNIGELSRIKGDAIGNTLYSERFVLSTLLKLTKLENDAAVDEAFEKDLCALWDMTIEDDVVKLLLDHNVLELLAQCIEATQDKRLTEILVGIVGNMCSVARTRSELGARSEIIATLLQLISCSDALTLVQLMRLLAVVHVYDDSGTAELWYKQIHLMPTFVEHFAFILQNSVNVTLLTHALEALNAVLAKFAVIDTVADSSLSFADIFVCEPLVCGTLEAFKLLVPSNVNQHSDSTDQPVESSQATRKTMQIFLNIHVILVQFKEAAKGVYEPHLNELLNIMAQILTPLCSSDYLLPLSSNEQDVVDNVNEIFLALDDPFDDNCFTQMITIWELTQDWIEERQKRPQPSNDFEGDEDDTEAENEAISFAEDMCMSILYFLTRMVHRATYKQLNESLHKQSPHTIIKLIDVLKANDTEEDFKECCQKLNETFEHLNRLTGNENDSIASSK